MVLRETKYTSQCCSPFTDISSLRYLSSNTLSLLERSSIRYTSLFQKDKKYNNLSLSRNIYDYISYNSLKIKGLDLKEMKESFENNLESI